MDPIRVLDLGLVPPLRSQAIYHGIAYAMNPDTPDTIILVGPTDPYLCIGYHQELEKEVDADDGRQAGLPIYRREVGGGAVYLDRGNSSPSGSSIAIVCPPRSKSASRPMSGRS